MKQVKEVSRDFKGIWIPREIWLDRNLTPTEIILYAEIDSLDNEKGCTASDQYLSDFMGCSKTAIQNHLSSLRKKGYIKTKSFDGRNRSIKCIALTKSCDEHSENLMSTTQEKSKSSIRENKDYNKAENKVEILTFDTIKIKENKYNSLIQDYGEKVIKDYIERAQDYFAQIGEKKASKYHDHGAMIGTWIRNAGIKKKPKPPDEPPRSIVTDEDRAFRKEMDEKYPNLKGMAFFKKCAEEIELRKHAS